MGRKIVTKGGGGGGSNSQRWIEHKIVFPRALLPSALRTISFRARLRATSACSTRSFLSEMVPSRALSATASQTSRIPADRKSCIARVRCLASRRCFIYIYILREEAIKGGRDVLVSFMLLYLSIKTGSLYSTEHKPRRSCQVFF